MFLKTETSGLPLVYLHAPTLRSSVEEPNFATSCQLIFGHDLAEGFWEMGSDQCN